MMDIKQIAIELKMYMPNYTNYDIEYSLADNTDVALYTQPKEAK
jgi:hypothetical protein